MTDAGAGFKAFTADGSIGRSAAPSSSLRTAITTAWRRHRDLLRNAISLVATTGVSSALGIPLLGVGGPPVRSAGGRIRLGLRCLP